MKKINWWRFTTIFISVWYALATLLIFVFDIYSLNLVSWLKNALIFIGTYFTLFRDEAQIAPLFFIPIILGILGILGAVFQKERTKAERVCFAVIPCIGLLFSLSTMLSLQIPGLHNANTIPLIFTAIVIIWIAVDTVLSIVNKRKG